MIDISPTAYKGIILLKRNPEMTKEQLLEWFIREHAPYPMAVDSIYRYTMSLIEAPGLHYKFPNGEPPFDMINEIWCKDRATLDAAYAQLNKKGGPKHAQDAVSDRHAFIAAEYVVKGK